MHASLCPSVMASTWWWWWWCTMIEKKIWCYIYFLWGNNSVQSYLHKFHILIAPEASSSPLFWKACSMFTRVSLCYFVAPHQAAQALATWLSSTLLSSTSSGFVRIYVKDIEMLWSKMKGQRCVMWPCLHKFTGQSVTSTSSLSEARKETDEAGSPKSSTIFPITAKPCTRQSMPPLLHCLMLISMYLRHWNRMAL